MIPSFISIGQLSRSHGVKGVIKAIIDSEIVHVFDQLEYVYLNINGDQVPFFVEEVKWIDDDQIFIKFEDVNNPEKAKSLSGGLLYVSDRDQGHSSCLEKKTDTDQERPFIGYTLTVEGRRDSWIILRIDEYPSQSMFVIEIKGQEYLIPFVEDYIESIDDVEKIIQMNVPIGLIP